MLRSLKGIEFSNLFNCAMEDIRLKQHALEVRRVWELVMRDPHLKRLGDWLVNEEEETQAEKWRLERKFLRTPWIGDLKLTLSYCWPGWILLGLTRKQSEGDTRGAGPPLIWQQPMNR